MRIVAPFVLLLVFACAATWPGHLVLAQSYPVKPIRLIVPWTPGGTADILARLMGQRLTESFGQQVIVHHRPEFDRAQPLRQIALRRAEGFRADFAHRVHILRAVGQPARAGEERAGARQARQVASRGAQLLLAWQRYAEPSL